MRDLYREVKELNISVLHISRLLGIRPRTMQYIFDAGFNDREEEEKKVKYIIATHIKLENKLKTWK